MVLSFSFSNVFSFREKQEISFIPEGLKEFKYHLHNPNPFDSKEELLTSLALYGHNSFGKSNVIKAVHFFKNFIRYSFKQPNLFNVEPFLLNIEALKEPSFFEIIIYIKETKYRYGFEIKSNKIISEWLYYSTAGVRENYLFQRVEQDFVISKSWNKENGNKIDLQSIPFSQPNILLLSVLSSQNISKVREISEKIDKMIILNDINNKVVESAVKIFSNPKYQEEISNFIKGADLGFSTIFDKIEKKLKENSDYNHEFLSILYKDEIEKFELYTKHAVYNKEFEKVDEIKFEMLKKESDGSIKFFIISSFLVYAIKNQLLICIDELDSKLHNDLLEFLINRFHNPQINSLGAQLIFTTHNSIFLDKKLRRDQFLIAEKNKYGESSIKKLHTKETPIRIDSSIEKDYRKGNLGGTSKNVNKINIQSRLFD